MARQHHIRSVSPKVKNSPTAGAAAAGAAAAGGARSSRRASDVGIDSGGSVVIGDQYATNEADVSAVASGFDVVWARAREMAIEERRYSNVVGTRMVGIISKDYEWTGVWRA